LSSKPHGGRFLESTDRRRCPRSARGHPSASGTGVARSRLRSSTARVDGAPLARARRRSASSNPIHDSGWHRFATVRRTDLKLRISSRGSGRSSGSPVERGRLGGGRLRRPVRGRRSPAPHCRPAAGGPLEKSTASRSPTPQ
jgi:hypothetical protein